MNSTKLRILFLCRHNSCRSVMAEAWTRQLKGDYIEARSAGFEERRLDPRAVLAMGEVGVSLMMHRTMCVGYLGGLAFDYVVIVCDIAHDACSVFPEGTKVVHMVFDDPPKLAEGAASEEEALSHYRRVRDEIRAFVETLPAALTESTGAEE